MPQKPSSKQSVVRTGALSLPVQTWSEGRLQHTQDSVAEEVPVALLYNGEPHAVMMATPQDLADFALGFSLTEEIVSEPAQVEALEIRALGEEAAAGFEVRMRIPPPRQQLLQQRQRSLAGRTGCGLCGAQAIAEAMRAPRRVPAGVAVGAGAVHRALEQMRVGQTLNAATGAVHAAAWADADGGVSFLREDIGRHNALDKLVGALLNAGLDPAQGFAVITSRASYEMALKAAIAGIPLLAAISAPTARAIRVAQEAGLSLIGFARSNCLVVYACPARLLEANPPPRVAGAIS
jgi:FdhD protein